GRSPTTWSTAWSGSWRSAATASGRSRWRAASRSSASSACTWPPSRRPSRPRSRWGGGWGGTPGAAATRPRRRAPPSRSRRSRPAGGAHAAVPAELADGRRHVVPAGDDGHAEPPAVAVEVAGDQARRRLLLGRQLVGRHELDRGPGQDPPAARPAAVQQHLAEREIVVGGGDEPGRARRELGRAAPLTTVRLVVEPERPGSRVGQEAGREPVQAGGRHAEPGVGHAERLEHALPEERLQRPARGPR